MSVVTLDARCVFLLATVIPAPPAAVSNASNQATDGLCSAIGKKRGALTPPTVVVCQSPQLLTMRLLTRSQRVAYSVLGAPESDDQAIGGSPLTQVPGFV